MGCSGRSGNAAVTFGDCRPPSQPGLGARHRNAAPHRSVLHALIGQTSRGYMPVKVQPKVDAFRAAGVVLHAERLHELSLKPQNRQVAFDHLRHFLLRGK